MMGGSARGSRSMIPAGQPALTAAYHTDRGQVRYAPPMADDPARRPLLSAELLSIGSELTVGETRDTNAGELARALTIRGVSVGRLTALPDRLDVVTEAFRAGLERADLVVSTGGLGPTPDDLTREAIAAALGETPEVDPALEAWLRDLWRRREMPFPELNLKQAWLIPSAEALPNPNGTAPGWFVRRADGRVVVALPGPPREMRPMWRDEVLPRLEAAGLGSRRRGPDVPARRHRRVAGRRPARRVAAAVDQPGRRDVRPGRGGRRPDLGDRATGPRAPRNWSRSPRRPCSASSATTSGRPARRRGRARSVTGWTSSAGPSRSSRSGRPASSPASSATSRGSASASPSPPTRPARSPMARSWIPATAGRDTGSAVRP